MNVQYSMNRIYRSYELPLINLSAKPVIMIAIYIKKIIYLR